MIIVIAADATFFGLLRCLLLSIEEHRPPPGSGPDVAIGLLDIGLAPEQRAWAEGRVDHIVEPGWDLDLPAEQRRAKPHLRALTARPFLPVHFPGFDTYLWIDADVWLQNWWAVDLYRAGARHDDIAVTPHSDRAYPLNREMLRLRHKSYTAGFGRETAEALWLENYLNAGIFAARADSPLWGIWAEAFQQAIAASPDRMTLDQAALNFAWYRRGLSAQLLPAVCNWQCHLGLPAWNPRAGVFCEPYLPYAPISMLHLTGRAKNDVYEIKGLDGKTRRMQLRYPREKTCPAAQPAG